MLFEIVDYSEEDVVYFRTSLCYIFVDNKIFDFFFSEQVLLKIKILKYFIPFKCYKYGKFLKEYRINYEVVY